MQFYKNIFIIIISLSFINCSKTIDKKALNEISKSHLLPLSQNKKNNLVFLKSLHLDGQSFERNHYSINIERISYRLKACFGINLQKDLVNINLKFIDEHNQSSIKTIDNTSCIYWIDHIIPNYARATDLKIFQKNIYIGKAKILIRYGIDHLNQKPFFQIRTHDEYNKYKKKQEMVSFNKIIENDMIEMTSIKLTPSGFGEIHPRNDQNIIDKPFRLETCLKYKANNIPLTKYKINARLRNIEKKTSSIHQNNLYLEDYQLDAKGCASLEFSLKFARYSNTRRIPYNFTLSVLKDDEVLHYVERKICLYPWSNNAWIFGQDALYSHGGCKKDPLNTRSRIHIDQANIMFLGHNQEIGFQLNSDLDLIILKTFEVTMFPKIDYGNLFESMNPILPFSEGKLRLNALVLAPSAKGEIKLTPENLHRFKIISTASKVVMIEAGKLMTDIDLPFKFTDMAYIHTRTILVLKLEQVQQTKYSPIPGIASGTFHASTKINNIHLYGKVDLDEKITNNEDQKIYAEHQQLKNKLNIIFLKIKNDEISKQEENHIIDKKLQTIHHNMSEENFIKEVPSNQTHHKYQEMTFKKLNKRLEDNLNESEIEGLSNNNYSRETMKKICSLFFVITKKLLAFNSNHQDCLNSPNDHFKIRSFRHINKIISTPRIVRSNTMKLYQALGEVLSSGEQKSNNVTHKISRGLKSGLTIPFIIPLLSMSGTLSYDYSKMKNKSIYEANQTRNSMNNTIELYVENVSYEFEASAKTCITIEGIKHYDYSKKSFFDIIKKTSLVLNKNRFRICKEDYEKEFLTEFWYYIGEGHQFSNLTRDKLNYNENKYTVIIRGQERMNEFINTINQKSKDLFLHSKTRRKSNSYLNSGIDKYKSLFDKNNDLVDDLSIKGTIEIINVSQSIK